MEENYIDINNPQFFADLLATPPIENPNCGESSEFSVVQMEDTSVHDDPLNYDIAPFSQPEFDTNNLGNFSGMFMFLCLYYIRKKNDYMIFFTPFFSQI